MGKPTCDACGAPLMWRRNDRSGRPMPLNPDPVPAAPKIVAVNPRSGKGHVLKTEDMPNVPRWAAAGVVFHESHYATCPNPELFRGGAG